MKLSHLLTQGEEIYGIKGVFEKGVLYSGKPVLVFKNLQSGKEDKYLVLASLKNWPRFQKWIGKRSKVDMKKTAKTYEMLQDKELQGVLLNAKVYIDDNNNDQEDKIDERD
jgi:hypothetical protein